MKSNRILTALVLVLLFSAVLMTCALAMEVHPVPVDHDRTDLANGSYSLTVRSADRIAGSNYFIAVLYQQDVYDGERIQALAPGDTVYADDRKWTVKEIVSHPAGEDPAAGVTLEVFTEEEPDSYLVFNPREDGTYAAVINDWIPVTLLGSVKVTLPLGDGFEYIRISSGEEEDPAGEAELKGDLDLFGGDSFTAYNTTCEFRNGGLVRVTHADYPQGPAEYEETLPVPVWKFCHGLRDGLDIAVITGWRSDCEEGSIQVEMTPEETEEIRRLAINGMVTAKGSDESVTGGTWFYRFETPGGKHLLTIELYKGMIVAPDGMYRYK